MLRPLVVGLTVMLAVGATLLFLPNIGVPPDPHVRLPDRGSTRIEAPGSTLEGIGPAVTNVASYAAGVHEATVRPILDALHQVELAQIAEAEEAPQRHAHSSVSVSSWDGTGTPCSIPAYICDRESGGDPTVYNHQGSGASGKYQFMPGTWNGYGGYANAADAPEWVQDEKAVELWAGGNGCSHWSACG